MVSSVEYPSSKIAPVWVRAWLWLVAVMVLAMVVVGGATRLTDSGLSITEWRVFSGALPPMSQDEWNRLFAQYQAIPQFRLVNPDMQLEGFKSIYWWEWAHRLLGRSVGLVFGAPLLVFLATRQIPRRLVWPCGMLLVLGGLQGLVGWWMVASGLTKRISVAPERLATHLGLALCLMCALIWVALDAGKAQRGRPERSQWSWMPHILWGAIFLQCLLGALVAGNDAGLVNTDWPLMSGKWFPGDYAAASVWATIAHSIAAVQFHHRILAYGLMLAAALLLWKLPYGWKALRPLAWTSGRMLAFMILFQAVLGILTLMLAVPIGLGIAHQLMAALVLSTATVFLWASRA